MSSSQQLFPFLVREDLMSKNSSLGLRKGSCQLLVLLHEETVQIHSLLGETHEVSKQPFDLLSEAEGCFLVRDCFYLRMAGLVGL